MVTLTDVARHAGVSPSTVSYVLSGKRSISPATRARVLASIELLDYHPHAGARALASNRTNVIALMIPLRTDMFVPVIMEIAIAVTTVAREHGQDVLLLTKDEGIAGVRRIAAGGQADALILMDIELHDERLPFVRTAATPAVLIGLPARPSGLTCVDLDFDAAGALCAERLADLGHRDVAFVGEGESVYQRNTGFAVRTLDGFLRGAAERGLRAVHRTCSGSHEGTVGTVSRILEERPATSAFVVQNEAAIPSLLSFLRHSGRAVPEDASVIAICPEQVAVQSSPRLTSVSVPAQAMGRRAVELVMGLLDRGAEPSVTLLVPELTERESSAPTGGRPGWSLRGGPVPLHDGLG